MYIPFQFAYLVLTIPFLLIWLLLYLLKKDTRKEQLIMSFLLMPLGPISEILYFQDYWTPPSVLFLSVGPFALLVEDLLFIFSIGGIASVIYKVIFRKKLSKLPEVSIHKVGLPIIFISASLVTFLLFWYGLNSIFATSVGFVLAALWIIGQRKDLFTDSLVSGFCVMLVMFISYFFLFNVISNSENLVEQGWLIYHTSFDIRLFNIPMTEMVWGFSWGMLVGPLYEFVVSPKS